MNLGYAAKLYAPAQPPALLLQVRLNMPSRLLRLAQHLGQWAGTCSISVESSAALKSASISCLWLASSRCRARQTSPVATKRSLSFLSCWACSSVRSKFSDWGAGFSSTVQFKNTEYVGDDSTHKGMLKKHDAKIRSLPQLSKWLNKRPNSKI